MTRTARNATVVVAAAVSLWSAACTSVVDGTAVRPAGESRTAATVLGERDLVQILLDDTELNDLLGADGIEITDEADEMTDDSDGVSAPECVGALYSAEEPVYDSTGYIAVLTRLASEPGEDYQHWVEETAVALPSEEAAATFVAESTQQWQDCAGRTVSISDGDDWYDWDLSDVVTDGGILTQTSTAVDSVQWQCEHAIAAVSNVIVEASVCAEQVSDEATTVITEMIAKAAQL